ncbi:MAG: hypothetical protein WC680_00150 [Sulfuricurvum sp.]|jgi:hypothetical protein
MNQKKSFNSIDYILLILWGIGSLVAVLLVIAISKIGLYDIKGVAPLIAAFAILISAGIASASIMKSIHASKQNEKEKSEKEILRKKKYVYNIMHTIWITMSSFKSKVASLPMPMLGTETEVMSDEIRRDLKSNSESVKKLIDSIFVENVLPYLTDEQQNQISELHMFFYDFLSTHIDMPKMSLSPQELNESAIRDYDEFKTLINDYIKNNNDERS